MDKEKLEFERWKMAENLSENFHINGEGWDASDFEWAAHCLQMDGYRKASDVAREIFEEIEDVLNHIGYFDELDFNALKKKYTEDTE